MNTAVVCAECVAFPTWVRDYLFNERGEVLPMLPDLTPLRQLVQAHRSGLLAETTAAFAQGWPAQDAAVVSELRLAGLIDGLPDQLAAVLRRLRRRLDWALDQITRLEATRRLKGTLDPDDDAQFARCDRLVKRLKGTARRARSEGEGYDDTYTLGLLAAEGFLPGYGLDIGTVSATAVLPRPIGQDFNLSRPPTMALRELVPGNLLYANGHRFVARTYQLAVQDAHTGARAQTFFQVDAAHGAVGEESRAPAGAIAALGESTIRAVPVCDVELAHRSQINDEEDYRFQMPVAVYGLRQERHDGGNAYRWGPQALQHVRGVRFRLVNVGPGTAQAALDVVRSCPSACERACVDCLLAFENGFYHKHLDRRTAAERLAEWGGDLVLEHAIPARLPSAPADRSGLPVNAAEAALKDMLAEAGFAAPKWHHRIDLGPGLGWTEPDCFYTGDEDEPGICLYLDGLSRHIHGNPATAERDRQLRASLRNQDYRVLEIAATDLFDQGAMVAHFRKLARWLDGKERAEAVAADSQWYRPPVVAERDGVDADAGAAVASAAERSGDG